MSRPLFLTVFLALPAAALARLVCVQPGALATEDERVAFTSSSEDLSGQEWVVRDWQGAVRARGAWPSSIPLLPPGYYAFAVGTNRASFVVVRRTPCRNLQSDFATDSAFSGCNAPNQYDCAWYGGNTYRVSAELMGRCGLTHTRERTEWRRMNPAKGVYDFGLYLTNAILLKKNGIITEGMVHTTPPWAGRDAQHDLPSDLVALHRFMEKAVPAFAPYYDSWEFWNEPELGSTHEAVWEYAAAYKAFALGCRKAPAKTVVLTGSLSDIDRDGYCDSLGENEIYRYADALNIHTYNAPVNLPAWHEKIHAYLKRHGVATIPIWLTEFGTGLDGHGTRPSVRKGLKAHSPEQELLLAEFYPKAAILHRFGGITRSWAFLFGCYNEQQGEKDWGTMRRDGTVKPVCAALSALTGELGDAAQQGECRLGEGLRGFVYRQPSGLFTLAFWSVSEVDTASESTLLPKDDLRRTFSFACPNGSYGLTDVMGTPSRVAATNGVLALTATRFPQYLSGLPFCRVDTPSAAKGEIRPFAPPSDLDLSVIVRPKLDARDFSLTARKSRAELKKSEGRLTLEVWNLSNKAKSGSLRAEGATLRGLPDRIDVPAWGKAEMSLACVPPSGTNLEFRLDIGGTFNGKKITRASVRVGNLKRFWEIVRPQRLTAADSPSAWKRNDNAKTFSCTWDAKERAIRFDVDWGERRGAWFYPVYTLNPTTERLEGVKAIEFEVKTVQNKVENDVNCAYLMGVFGSKSHWLDYAHPTTRWERRLVWLHKDAANYTALRFGVNPKGSVLTYWIRNIRLLRLSEN